MNTGGSHGGHKAYGPANSKDVFGRGLSEMITVAEVDGLAGTAKSASVAGAFQIIPDTMKMVVQLQAFQWMPSSTRQHKTDLL